MMNKKFEPIDLLTTQSQTSKGETKLEDHDNLCDCFDEHNFCRQKKFSNRRRAFY